MNIMSFLIPDALNNEVEALGERAEAGEKVAPLTLKSDEEADDCLARILWAKSKIAKNDEVVKAQKEALTAQLANYEHRLNGRLKNYLEYQEYMLKEYLHSVLGKDKDGNYKTGTIPLFSGNACLKKPSESCGVDNEEVVVKWLKDNGYSSAINVKETVKKSEVKKLFKKDKSGQYYTDNEGNVIQGMHVEKVDGLQLSVTSPKTTKTKVA